MKEFTLEYLNEQKEKHSKMENLLYIKLKLQSYLKNPEYLFKQLKICLDGEQEQLNSKLTTKASTSPWSVPSARTSLAARHTPCIAG